MTESKDAGKPIEPVYIVYIGPNRIKNPEYLGHLTDFLDRQFIFQTNESTLEEGERYCIEAKSIGDNPIQITEAWEAPEWL